MLLNNPLKKCENSLEFINLEVLYEKSWKSKGFLFSVEQFYYIFYSSFPIWSIFSLYSAGLSTISNMSLFIYSRLFFISVETIFYTKKVTEKAIRTFNFWEKLVYFASRNSVYDICLTFLNSSENLLIENVLFHVKQIRNTIVNKYGHLLDKIDLYFLNLMIPYQIDVNFLWCVII